MFNFLRSDNDMSLSGDNDMSLSGDDNLYVSEQTHDAVQNALTKAKTFVEPQNILNENQNKEFIEYVRSIIIDDENRKNLSLFENDPAYIKLKNDVKKTGILSWYQGQTCGEISVDENGKVEGSIINDLKTKLEGKAGFVFVHGLGAKEVDVQVGNLSTYSISPIGSDDFQKLSPLAKKTSNMISRIFGLIAAEGADIAILKFANTLLKLKADGVELNKIILTGHSRGADICFALSTVAFLILGYKVDIYFSGIDPVAGKGKVQSSYIAPSVRLLYLLYANEEKSPIYTQSLLQNIDIPDDKFTTVISIALQKLHTDIRESKFSVGTINHLIANIVLGDNFAKDENSLNLPNDDLPHEDKVMNNASDSKNAFLFKKGESLNHGLDQYVEKIKASGFPSDLKEKNRLWISEKNDNEITDKDMSAKLSNIEKIKTIVHLSLKIFREIEKSIDNNNTRENDQGRAIRRANFVLNHIKIMQNMPKDESHGLKATERCITLINLLWHNHKNYPSATLNNDNIRSVIANYIEELTRNYKYTGEAKLDTDFNPNKKNVTIPHVEKKDNGKSSGNKDFFSTLFGFFSSHSTKNTTGNTAISAPKKFVHIQHINKDALQNNDSNYEEEREKALATLFKNNF